MYKPRVALQIDTPKFDSRTESVQINPIVIEAKWTKNNHLVADELHVTIGHKESGIDPRALKNARCNFWMWDQAKGPRDLGAHLRFTGICVSAERRLADNGWVVDMTFHDYTTLFIHNKPLKTKGMPEWSDTLEQAWKKICDNTGWEDKANDQILSSVKALRDSLVFLRPELASRTIGEMVPKRFHAASKPTPKSRASSWDVWQWIMACLGLVSWIDRNECFVDDTVEHFTLNNPITAVYGSNILSLEEKVDATITQKGIRMLSIDTITGQVLESHYPPPGDERIKTKRSAAGKKSEGGATITSNEVSGEYEEYTNWAIQTQKALDDAAKAAYIERSAQQLKGSFKTAEMVLPNDAGDQIDIFNLRAGDAIRITLDPTIDRDILSILGGSDAAVAYLVKHCDYDEDVARAIVQNWDVDFFKSLIYHLEQLEISLGPDHFEVTIGYHNLVLI